MTRHPTGTKSRILKAARSLYSTHGCNGTTLEDIITASGITKGAFYHYFKSKGSLCEIMLDEVMLDYRHLAEAIDPGLEPIEQLREMLGKLADLNASGEWVNCRLMVRLSADSYESYPKIQRKIQDFWQWYIGFYEELLQKCRAAGQISTRLDVKTQTRLLISLMAGAIMLEKITPTQSASANLADIIIETLRS